MYYICTCKKAIVYISIVFFIYPSIAFGAWTYEQSFDSLSLGDLDGQDNWTCTSDTEVVDDMHYYGGQSAHSAYLSWNCDRSISSIDEGNVYFAVYLPSTDYFSFDLFSGTSFRTELNFSSGNIRLYSGSFHNIGTYDLNEWIPVNFSFSGGKFKVRVYQDSAWSDWSTEYDMTGGNSVDKIRWYVDAGYFYFDQISTSDITELVPPEEPETPSSTPLICDYTTSTDCFLSDYNYIVGNMSTSLLCGLLIGLVGVAISLILRT